MKRYTETISFQRNAIGEKCILLNDSEKWVPKPFSHNPIWSRIYFDFDAEHFMYVCPPVDIGKMELDGITTERVLRCPIKVAGDPIIRLPLELECCLPLVRHIAELERHISEPEYNDLYAHISFECTKVKKNTSQRVGGWHVDGFQGVRTKRHRVEHSYIWADCHATEFCLQPFFIQHLDPNRHNIFDEITNQANEQNAHQGIAGHIYLIDPYVVHRSPVMKKTCQRSVARITFTKTELEDPENTKNLGIELDQDYDPRIDVRDRLSSYDGKVPWEMYGLRK